MGRSASITTTIACDYEPCTKVFHLYDDPKKDDKGIENIVTSKDAWGQELYFCSPLHMVKHWVDFIKKSPEEKEKTRTPQAEAVVKPTEDQIKKFAGMHIIEPVPEPPEDLSLQDNE